MRTSANFEIRERAAERSRPLKFEVHGVVEKHRFGVGSLFKDTIVAAWIIGTEV